MKRKEWASRLLAVGLCMTVAALMVLPAVPGAEAKRPPNYLSYYGPDTEFVAGWNLVTFLCKPMTASGVQYTAHMVCERTRDNFNIERHLITQISYVDQHGTEITFVHANHATDFTMQGGLSYWVIATEAGHIPISSGDYGFSIVPRHSDMRLYGDNEPDCTGWNYVGYQWSMYFPPQPPGPDGPPEHWARMLSSFMSPIKQLDGVTPYTTGVLIAQWNTTSDQYQQYNPLVPTHDYVHDSNYGVGNIFWGLLIYLPNGGYWEIVN